MQRTYFPYATLVGDNGLAVGAGGFGGCSKDLAAGGLPLALVSGSSSLGLMFLVGAGQLVLCRARHLHRLQYCLDCLAAVVRWPIVLM